MKKPGVNSNNRLTLYTTAHISLSRWICCTYRRLYISFYTGSRFSIALDGHNDLDFHWKSMSAPVKVLDEIVVHKLTHMVHCTHPHTDIDGTHFQNGQYQLAHPTQALAMPDKIPGKLFFKELRRVWHDCRSRQAFSVSLVLILNIQFILKQVTK